MSYFSSSFRKSIRLLQEPPEFILSNIEREEVIAFELSLCRAEFPEGLRFLASKINKPTKNIHWLADKKNGLETLCLDWYVQTEEGRLTLTQLGWGNGQYHQVAVKKFLAGAVVNNRDTQNDNGFIQSRKWGQQQLEKLLKERLENGKSTLKEPEYFSVILQPSVLVKIASYSEELKKYYSLIESALQTQEMNNVNESKLVMVQIHKDRLNALIATNYRELITLLEQYKYAPSILDSQYIDRLIQLFRKLKSLDTNDIDKMARLYSVIDKFITGVDIENRLDKLGPELEFLITELQKHTSRLKASNDYSLPTEQLDRSIDAKTLKHLFETVLSEYSLLERSNTKTIIRQKGQKWRVVISDIKENLSVLAEKGIIWIPKSFNRNLYQKKPVGVLPLLDHEITHVIQHKNGASLHIGLLEFDRGARARIWFEVGATQQENISFIKFFNINRGPNLHYLRAMQTQLKGGSITDCILTFYKSLLSSKDITDKQEAISFAVERTLRLFQNGREYTQHSSFITNTEPLEFALQELILRQLPEDKDWLYFVGRANFQTLAELHRIGWLNRDEVFIPERMPAEIALEEIRSSKE